jgi:signal transduction histidine kinase
MGDHARLRDSRKCPVLGEAIRLRQIVSNLLDNAVKYNAPGGKIRVLLTGAKREWNFDISNTGPGIPAEQAPRIFDRFQRGQHHADISGHGLGLSLCHELARAHGGSLTLVRSDAEWTTFRLTLCQPNPNETGSA